MKFRGNLKKELFLELALLIAGIFGIIKFYKSGLILTVLLILVWMVGLVFWHKKHDVIFYVIAAVIGPLAEIVCVHYGVWSYSNPDFLGIPIWLPFVWGISVLVIKRIAETLVRIEMK